MNFIDKQHVIGFKIGQQRRQITGLGDHRPGRRPEPDAELPRDDLRKRGLAEPRRSMKQHMIQRIAPLPRRGNEHPQIFPRRFLPDKFIERFRAESSVNVFGTMGRGG